jgi:hypothetical protein
MVPLALPAIYLAAVGDAGNYHQPFGINDRVDDTLVADSNPVVVGPGQFDGAGGPGIAGEAVDRDVDAGAEWIVKSPISTLRLRVQADLVGGARLVYLRTSDHGTDWSRSSRA